MAAGTYARLVADTVSSGSADANEIVEIAKKAVAQVERAAEVIRRLRALVRLDRSNRAPVPFDRIIKETLDLCRPDLDRRRVTSALLPCRPIFRPSWWISCRSNRFCSIWCAIRSRRSAIVEGLRGTIVIEAKEADADFVEVRVADQFRPRVFARLHRRADSAVLVQARPMGSASDCRCADQSSRPMAADCGWMQAREGRRSASPCRSQSSPDLTECTMTELIT